MRNKYKQVLAVSLIVFSLLISTPTVSSVFLPCLEEEDFIQIGDHGFDDSANSYSWGMEYFKGNLYVGTVRHHAWSIMQGMLPMMGGILPIDLEDLVDFPGPEPETWGDPDWADDMAGRIYRRINGDWEEVYRSPVWELETPIELNIPGYDPIIIPAGYYPKAYGYRVLGTYGEYVYACGVGTWFPPMPFSSVIRSMDGETWEDVTGVLDSVFHSGTYSTTNARGLVEFMGELHVSASIPAESPTMSGDCVVWASSDPGTEDWKMVSLPGFGNPDNDEIYYLIVFNDELYASTMNYNTGFEVWKTDGELNEATVNPDDYVWELVIDHGFGDTWNQYGMDMEVFGDYLYVGSAVGAGMVLKDFQPVGTRPIDVIRIDAEGNAELVIGAYIPRDPIAMTTGHVRGEPISGWPAGFGNMFNVYTWKMREHDGCLYLGTLDMSGSIMMGIFDILAELPDDEILTEIDLSQYLEELEALKSEVDWSLIPEEYWDLIAKLELAFETGDYQGFIGLLIEYFGGGDLWKSCDGVHWMPVTLSGFGNPHNYGIRRLVSVCDTYLYVGTANPYTDDPDGGCEVWVGAEKWVWSCDEFGDEKTVFDYKDDVYVKGKGFPSDKDVDIYIMIDDEPYVPTMHGVGHTDSHGVLPPTLIWNSPLTEGEYDIWVDVDQNGEYNPCIDIYFCITVNRYRFFVIPEVQFGTLIIVIGMIAALAIRARKNGLTYPIP